MSINMANVKSITLSGVSVKKIENLNGDVLWQEKKQGYYIKVDGYYINRSTGNSVTSSTTAGSIWYIDSDNRIYCLVGDTKRYLECMTSGTYTVYDVTTLTGDGYTWLYKNGNYITGTIDNTTYYLYRYKSGVNNIRMRTTATTITFEQAS